MRTLGALLVAAAAGMAQDGAGWHDLNQDAWRGYRKPGFPGQGWVEEEGALHHTKGGGGGDIITRRKYRNFELRLEWKVAARANSGIMYGVAEGDGASYTTGPEYQVLDDSGHRAGGLHSAGALYGIWAPRNKKTKPAGEWNTARIVRDGARVEHWLNGVKVVEGSFGSDDFGARVASSKFARWKDFGKVKRGHICLQDHGDEVWYRRIRIRELAPEKERRGLEVELFDGKGLDGWAAHPGGGAAKLGDVWSVRDGMLVCRGRPAGYIHTTKDYQNFILKLEWSWPGKPGNSGVLFRMTGEHRVWPRSIEAQLMAGSAGDFWNIGAFPMTTVAARTRGRNTKKSHGNEKPSGAWNEYEIIVDGSWVQLRVNGQVLNEAWDCQEIAGRICLQSEGAPIRFRNIRLIPLVDGRRPKR